MDEALRKKYIPMTETTYYTLLSVTVPRHGYAIIQYVSKLTEGRIVLGTGTLYTMVGRLVADGIIITVPQEGRKAYQITGMGLELLWEETVRLVMQLEDGRRVLNGEPCGEGVVSMAEDFARSRARARAGSERNTASGQRLPEGDPETQNSGGSKKAGFPGDEKEPVMAIRGGT